MARYKAFRITNKEYKDGYIRFELNGKVSYKNGSYGYIDCDNCSPFNGFYKDDYLEIDLDKTSYESYLHTFRGSEVRKCSADLVPFQSASSVAPSSFTSAVSSAHRSGSDYEAYVEQRDNRGEVMRSAFARRQDGKFYDGFFDRK